MHNYKQLSVWQNSVDFSVYCYKVTRTLPPDEKFGLISQMRRAVVSIAEGAGRNAKGEFIQFLGIAAGSACEVETQFIIAGRLGFLSETVVMEATAKVAEIQNKLHKLIGSLKNANANHNT